MRTLKEILGELEVDYASSTIRVDRAIELVKEAGEVNDVLRGLLEAANDSDRLYPWATGVKAAAALCNTLAGEAAAREEIERLQSEAGKADAASCEGLVKAWMERTGLGPDDAVLMHERTPNGWKWWVERKEPEAPNDPRDPRARDLCNSLAGEAAADLKERFLMAGWAYSHSLGGVDGVCSDGSCFRCRLAALLAEVDPDFSVAAPLDKAAAEGDLTVSEEQLVVAPTPVREALENYPCAKCGKPRTKAEGGTIFTVCDECWDASSSVPPAKDLAPVWIHTGDVCTTQREGESPEDLRARHMEDVQKMDLPAPTPSADHIADTGKKVAVREVLEEMIEQAENSVDSETEVTDRARAALSSLDEPEEALSWAGIYGAKIERLRAALAEKEQQLQDTEAERLKLSGEANDQSARIEELEAQLKMTEENEDRLVQYNKDAKTPQVAALIEEVVDCRAALKVAGFPSLCALSEPFLPSKKTRLEEVATEMDNTKHCIPAWTEVQRSVVDDWAKRIRAVEEAGEGECDG